MNNEPACIWCGALGHAMKACPYRRPPERPPIDNDGLSLEEGNDLA